MTYIYLIIPIIFTILVSFVNAKELSVILYSLLFYSAPYLCWALLQFVVKPRGIVVHAGYIAATISLLLIASVWLLPPDSSGLPLQWMAYWPLSAILIFLFSGVSYFVAKKYYS